MLKIETIYKKMNDELKGNERVLTNLYFVYS
jgi:hypothetical protein